MVDTSPPVSITAITAFPSTSIKVSGHCPLRFRCAAVGSASTVWHLAVKASSFPLGLVPSGNAGLCAQPFGTGSIFPGMLSWGAVVLPRLRLPPAWLSWPQLMVAMCVFSSVISEESVFSCWTWTVSTGDSSLTQSRASWRRAASVMSAFSLAIRRSSLLRAISASPSQNRSRRERVERASGSRLVILVARTWREWLNSSTVSAGRCCRQWNAANSCVSGR